MTSLACLALIVYHEARSEPVATQVHVAQVVINRAKEENLTICKSMVKPRSYSFYWDKHSNKIKDKVSYANILQVANKSLTRKSLHSRLFFSECRLKKRYKTKHKLIKVGHLCFY